jgi:Fe-S-cluster containining protein
VAAAGEVEPFGYVCRRCNLCCRNQRIQLNPYEVARLARSQGVSASAFRERFTVDGVWLAQTETGACVFLGPGGCTVHADRPLACRLYPLGRHVRDDGRVRFSRLAGEPGSAGAYTGEGTVADYLESQGAGPFTRAADDYFGWWMAASRASAEPGSPPLLSETEANDILDLDAAVERRCAAEGRSAPADLEARRRLHLDILDQRLERRLTLTRSDHHV